MKNLEIFTNPASNNKAIYIVSRDGHKIVDLVELLFCKAERNYTKIIIVTGREIIVPKSLCKFVSILKPYNFLRCNSSHLINLSKKGCFHRHYRKIYLANFEIPVPKDKCHEIFPVLTAFGFKEILCRTEVR